MPSKNLSRAIAHDASVVPGELALRMQREHFDKYEALAQSIGVDYLSRLALEIAPADRIRECLATDRHLNNIPLGRWDARDGRVRAGAFQAGQKAWSLSDTVCTLKHVARHHVAGAPAPEVAVSDRTAHNGE